MSRDFKKVFHIILIGLWLFLPAVLATLPLVVWVLSLVSVIRVEPFSLILAIPVVLQTLIVASYQRRLRPTKTIFGILLLGWGIQAVGIGCAWIAMGIVLEVSLLWLLFPLAIIAPQVLASVVYALFHLVGTKLRPPFFKRPTFPCVGIFVLVAIALIVTNFYTAASLKQAQIKQNQRGINYDVSDIAFRAAEKDTQLGRLPRPLRIFHTSSGYIGVTLTGERIRLPFLDAIGPGNPDQLFLDVFSDRVYFVRDGIGYAYDLQTKTTTTLPAPIQSALQEQFSSTLNTLHGRRIIAAHKMFIALADTEWAGTGDVVVYDVATGERIFQTVYLGYDQNRLVLFWVNGKGYRLILNGTQKPTKTMDSTIGNTMSVYLEERNEPYHRLSDDEITDGIGKIVFSGNNEWFYQDKTPIFTFTTAYLVEKYGGSKFSIRNMYLLDDGRVAVEAEKGLLVINLTDKHAETVEDQKTIVQLLGSAKLLSADDENAHLFLNGCGDDVYTDALKKEMETTFSFCLK